MDQQMTENKVGIPKPSVQIAHEVIGSIAAIAASEVEGVSGMTGSLVGGLTEMLGKRNFAKGVKTEVKDNQVAIDLYLVVKYGSRIPEVAQKVQEQVKHRVESMTGLFVSQVDIHIQGVSFTEPQQPLEPSESDH